MGDRELSKSVPRGKASESGAGRDQARRAGAAHGRADSREEVAPGIIVPLEREDALLRLAVNWAETAEVLGISAADGVQPGVRIGGGRAIPLDDTGTAVLPPAAARAVAKLGAWAALRAGADGYVLDQGVPVSLPKDLLAFRELLEGVERGRPDAPSLANEALAVWMRPGFDSFVCLPRLHFSPFAYHLDAAAGVLRRMRGRAVLADEVGLGKTIEAGLVLSELYLRRLAEHVLILVPAGLVEQWGEELERKFGLPRCIYGTAGWDSPALPPPGVALISLAAARRRPLRDRLNERSWDLVIVDEAHRLKNPASASARFVRSLQTRYLLFLTATPVENRMEDLFQLVSIVRPGLLGSRQEFAARYGLGLESGETSGAPRNLEPLQARMREVMVRHRRSEVALLLPRRLAETRLVAPGEREEELYRAVSRRVREAAAGASPASLLQLRSVQRLAGSSPQALVPSLERLGWNDLAEGAAAGGATEKTRVLVDLLRRRLVAEEKVVVFTAFRRTLDHLVKMIRLENIPVAVYHGGLSRREKDEAIRAFRDECPVLLTTEAAGEGRNLQFCHVLINFDLPWNPMQIEQRLGRIHRIGQEHDVVLTNLVALGTVEERILRVLEAKLNLFELVVGELDMIIGRIEDEFDFESHVFTAYVESKDDEEFDRRLEKLGDDLVMARREYLSDRERTDRLLPADDGEAR